MAKIEVLNSLEQNRNDFVPMDQVEEAINLCAENTRNRIKRLWQALDVTRDKVFSNHNLKQALLYFNLGEEYLKEGITDFAKTCLEISANLLEEESKLYNSVVNILQKIDSLEIRLN
ncbi:MAG TPA: hypothetical protein PKW55_01475 [Spirochaetota bacterium]|nr:hypothetical protein [Spirochaetota bacterium]HOM38887.1 hypothetical protein [Spirochaetota bacterium]HPQ49134.1 hypothetical protein [Spirochaetota bacterium]